jgi:hypothetical protein
MKTWYKSFGYEHVRIDVTRKDNLVTIKIYKRLYGKEILQAELPFLI